MKRLFYLSLLLFFLSSLFSQTKNADLHYDESQHQLMLFVNKKPAIKVNAASFSFHPELIMASDARIVVYVDSDSIFHPAADFSYNLNQKELWISRTTEGLGRTPFFDSYHKLEITADAIFWKTKTPILEFREQMFQQTDRPALFQSQQYFDPIVMIKNKGMNDVNPMLPLWELFKANQFEPLAMRHITSYFRRSSTDLTALLIDYAIQGFIEYDINNDKIYYRSKLAQFLNNESNRRDYDNLKWESKSHFATLNLINFDLNISDCEFFVLSDSKIVNVYPTNELVTIKKNRDLHFSGRVIGGLFDFLARDCTFDYDKFTIFMPQIDTILIYSEDKSKPKNLQGEFQLKKMKNVLEEVSGTIYIDAPSNKSGKKAIPDFPIFESVEGGKVFFDQKHILNGEYKRDTFYYKIDYFTIKNLDNYNSDSTRFEGRLVSGGIFPDIHQPIKVLANNSLGFVFQTDSSGLEMYDGKGRYFQTIELSDNGLRGIGKIEYLTSTSSCDSLIFFLQKVTGKVKHFEIAPLLAEVEYPKVSSRESKLEWLVNKDQFRVTNGVTPFSLYQESSLFGSLTLTPKKLIATGKLDFKRAELLSKSFTLKHHEIEAESADLNIFEKEKEKKYVFSSKNYAAKVNFETRGAEFHSLDSMNIVNFASNGFSAYSQSFTWNSIDQNLLRFVWKDLYKKFAINETAARELVKMNSKSNRLFSNETGKKRLDFNVQTVDYDFEKHILSASGVRYIPLGDAALIPHNGEITILENAKIPMLSKMRIAAPRENIIYELFDCTVNIENGENFRGSGFYDYIDENKSVKTLRFDSLWYFRATKGIANIRQTADFTLSPHFEFNGRAELNSTLPFLNFVGNAHLVHDCNKDKVPALRISQQVNPNDIMLEINAKSKDENDRKATVAIASSNETNRIYTRFGAAKDQINDSEYITTSGFIRFNKELGAFQAASKEKLANPTLPEKIISLYKTNCISIGEGAIDMGAKLGRVDFNTHGQVINYMQADSAVMRLTTSINFFFNSEALKLLNNQFAKHTDLKFVDPNLDQNYTQALRNILGNDGYNQFVKESSSGIQQPKLPHQLDVNFLFSTLTFTWSQENGAFQSQKAIPLIICGGKPVYKEIPGCIVIEKKGSRNNLFIYFELKKEFFFFQFENNALSVFSSDETFNNLITSTKAKDKTLSSENGESAFSYKLGNRGQKTRFTKKYFSE